MPINLKTKYILFAIILAIGTFASAQKHLPVPNKAKKSDEKILISNSKDILAFGKYLRRNGQPQTLVLAPNVSLSNLVEHYPQLDEVNQLVLQGNNDIAEDLFCKLPALSNVIFHVQNYDSSIVKAINDCYYLEEISYVFSRDFPVTENWFDLNNIKKINVLGILGKKELAEIVEMLPNVSNLEQLRISVDYSKDIPSNVAAIKGLKSFGFIDNLSFIINHTFYDLAVENYYINYWDAANQTSVMLPLDYYSDRVTLEEYDKTNISNIFYNGQVLPYFTIAPIAPPILKDIEIRTTTTIGTKFSIFDTIDRNEKAPPYFKTNPSVKVVSSKINPQAEYYQINPIIDNVIITENGFKILIPKGCLLLPDGNKSSNMVDVYFKYSNNIVDLALNGIPSQFDSFNDYFSLNNPQTITLYASENSVPLKVADNYAIDVEIEKKQQRSLKLDNAEPFWYPYDETGQNGLNRYKITPLNDTFGAQQLVDFADVRERYFNPDYFYVLDRNETKVKIPKTLKKNYANKPNAWLYQPFEKGMTLSKNEFYLKPGKALIGVRKISYNDSLRKEKVFFTIQNLISDKLFPELRYFAKYEFEYTGYELKKEFTKALLRGNKFFDVRIFYTQGENGGYVELKCEKGYIQLPFSILKSGTSAADESKQKAAFQKKYTKYETMLAKRYSLQQTHVKTYNAKANNEKEKVSNKTLFSIQQFGVYAAASIDTTAKYSQINLVINDAQGIPMDIDKIIIIYNQPQQADYFNNKAINVNFNKEFAVIAVNFAGDLYYATASQCKGLKSGEGSVVSLNTRLVSKELLNWSLLYKSLGFSKK